MRDLLGATLLQENAAGEYEDARARLNSPHRDCLADYIADNQIHGAKFAAKARTKLGMTDHDQLYS
ncbi:hypothetical protein [Rhizobium phaseoli]|uniref:Uncharacterized protein n=1 Tax=Rhizobium phaseoli TaxID=396 RepID=A0ABM6C9G6_9HYPH|nr:hypothetical protein [Rhizobium phaseoli]ANL84629.1 hypothetical protein AMC81_CH01848 [Rhizobium phaseoli]ANL91136.1 hypothetical protein AMC80_CH01848 [Rhizobium phaseoli]